MSQSLHCVTYVSRISPVNPHLLGHVVRTILTQSQHLNARDGITGILVFSNAYFAQALEGERTSVEAKFGVISRDTRHSLPTIVSQGPIASRSFSTWTMCARQISKLDNDILDRFERRGAFPPKADGGALLEQLRAIGRVHQEYFDRQMNGVVYL